jgi:hypothetical protein
LSYSVDVDPQGRYTFDILDEENTTLPIPLRVSGARQPSQTNPRPTAIRMLLACPTKVSVAVM